MILKSLKLKIFASFMLLIVMLSVAGIISIYEFKMLGGSVHGLIEDNYKTIEAAKTMNDALEREDSGILLLLLGQWEQGRAILTAADSVFNKAFTIASGNLTEVNEDQHINEIRTKYSIFKGKWERPIVDTEKEGNIDWYKSDIHQSFLDTKDAIKELMNLNQTSMYLEASLLKERSRRAIMPGIVTIVAAVVFSLLLNFFLSKYFVSPLSHLADAIKLFEPEQKYLRVDFTAVKEIRKLEQAISELIGRLLDN